MKYLLAVFLVNLCPESFATQGNDSNSKKSLSDRLSGNYQSSDLKTGAVMDIGLVGAGFGLETISKAGIKNINLETARSVDLADTISHEANTLLNLMKKRYVDYIALHESKYDDLMKLFQATVDEVDPKSSGEIREAIAKSKLRVKNQYQLTRAMIERSEYLTTLSAAITDPKVKFLNFFNTELTYWMADANRRNTAQFRKLKSAYRDFKKIAILPDQENIADALLTVANAKTLADKVASPRSTRLMRRLAGAGNALALVGSWDFVLRVFDSMRSSNGDTYLFPLIQLPYELAFGETETEEHSRAEAPVKQDVAPLSDTKDKKLKFASSAQ